MFYLDYDSKGNITKVSKVKGEISLEITRDRYVMMVSDPSAMSQYMVRRGTLIRKPNFDYSTNPAVPLELGNPNADFEFAIYKDGVILKTSVFTCGEPIQLYGLKDGNPWGKVNSVFITEVGVLTKFSKPINPGEYTWYVKSPIRTKTYSIAF